MISTGCGVTGTGLQLLVQRYTVTGTGVDCVTATEVAVNITRTGTGVDWDEIRCRILLCARRFGGAVSRSGQSHLAQWPDSLHKLSTVMMATVLTILMTETMMNFKKCWSASKTNFQSHKCVLSVLFYSFSYCRYCTGSDRALKHCRSMRCILWLNPCMSCALQCNVMHSHTHYKAAPPHSDTHYKGMPLQYYNIKRPAQPHTLHSIALHKPHSHTH